MQEIVTDRWPWPEGPTHPAMPVNDVHVWHADIGPHEGAGIPATDGLSPEEIERANAAGSATYRAEFVRTRQCLRGLLGRYLNLRSSEIILRTNEHGKPYLDPQIDQTLRFNLTHASGTALFALSCDREVGIDMDRLDRVSNWQGVANRSFSASERDAITGLPVSERGAAFMRGWIRKEAYAKARGAGFQYGFSRFTVSLAEASGKSFLLEDTNDKSASEKWALLDIHLEKPLSAALAIGPAPERDLPGLRCFRFR